MIRRILLLVLTVAIGFYAAAAVQAQGNKPTDNEVNEIAKGLYCPVCPNTPLDVCETQACQDWREEIKTQLIAGWTKEEIEDYFVAQYGERVLAEPERSGFTSMVWILPVVAVLLGLVVVVQALRSWKRGAKSEMGTAVTSPAINPKTLAEIEQELRHLE